MRITAFSDYAFRVLMYLAVHEGRRSTVGEIAESYGISLNHLNKVVQTLARVGLVHTVRGQGGGLTLARAPETVRLGEVVRACEGKRPYVECRGCGVPHCPIASSCALVGFLGDALEAFYADLNRHTLADLVSPDRVPELRRLLAVRG